MNHMVASGIIFGSDTNLKGFLRINCEMHQLNGTTATTPHLHISAFNMAGTRTTVSGLGNFTMTWGTTDSYEDFVNAGSGVNVTTYARTCV